MAKLACEELQDTLYFGGFTYTKERQVVGNKKTYVYVTPQFTLKIQGRNIHINGEKCRSPAVCKRIIQERYIE